MNIVKLRELDFNGREQLYYQLYDIFFQDIMDGKYKVGSLLPAESELMATYRVSRATVRKAMEMLSNDGLIEKMRGHGTFVKSLRPRGSLSRVIHYSRKNIADKAIAFKKVLDHREIRANATIAQYLRLEEGCPLIQLKRVRYADTQPMYLETSYFEKSWVPEVLERDFSKESLRAFLTNRYQIVWSYASQEIYSVVAMQEMADILSVEPGAPLLYIKRISYDADNVPREFVESYYRADNYHLVIELSI